MTKEQERELNLLKNKYKGDNIRIEEGFEYVIVKNYSINREFSIDLYGYVYSSEIPKDKMPLFGKVVLIMVPVYGILFFSLGEDFMIPIFILGVINFFMALGVIGI